MEATGEGGGGGMYGRIPKGVGSVRILFYSVLLRFGNVAAVGNEV